MKQVLFKACRTVYYYILLSNCATNYVIDLVSNRGTVIGSWPDGQYGILKI